LSIHVYLFNYSEHEHKKEEPHLKSFFTEEKESYTFYFDISAEDLPQKIEVSVQSRTRMEEVLLIAIE